MPKLTLSGDQIEQQAIKTAIGQLYHKLSMDQKKNITIDLGVAYPEERPNLYAVNTRALQILRGI